jgi:hypothetical protein
MEGRVVNRVLLSVALLALAPALLRAAAPVHTVSIHSDGRDQLSIAANTLIVQNFSWAQPTNLKVDGVSQTLNWTGNTAAPLLVPISGDWWIRKSTGRDGGYATQLATGFALGIADNPVGSGPYQFDLYAANDSNSTDWMHVRGGSGNTPGRMSFPSVPGYVPSTLGTTTTFSLDVDGTDDLLFTNGQLVIRHTSWNNPTTLRINGQLQTLTWTGNQSDPIALNLPNQFQFTQTAGRTALYPVETPAGLLLGADDELNGADTYNWTIAAIPEPSAALSLVTAMGVCTLRRARRDPTKQ